MKINSIEELQILREKQRNKVKVYENEFVSIGDFTLVLGMKVRTWKEGLN